MNWYKMAKINSWDDARFELLEELGREPLPEEVQERMLQENFSDRNKTSTPLVMAKKWEDKIPGGEADGKSPSNYENSQVERGKKVEFEHTDDPDTAREIAMDHLEEHDDYYVGLEHMENALKEIEERAKKKK